MAVLAYAGRPGARREAGRAMRGSASGAPGLLRPERRRYGRERWLTADVPEHVAAFPWAITGFMAATAFAEATNTPVSRRIVRTPAFGA